MKSGPVPGRAFLLRVIHRVWESTQHAYDREAYELGAINLQLLRALLDKSTLRGKKAQWVFSNKMRLQAVDYQQVTLDNACNAAHGITFEKWRHQNEMRLSRMAWELGRCIPDYDPQMDTASSIRRPEAFSGNLYQVPSKKIPSQPKPMRGMFGKGEEAS